MRIFTHCRGVPPKLRASTFRAFMPDKDWSTTGNLEDLIDHDFYLHGTDNLTSTATSPTMALRDCPVSGGREVNGTNYFAAPSAEASDATALVGEVTIQAWVYVSSMQEKQFPWCIGYSKDEDSGSAATILANNQLFGFGFNTEAFSGKRKPTSFRFLWEYDSSGSNVLFSSSQRPLLDQWFHIAMVRYDDPDNVGKVAFKFYVNGCQSRDSNGDLESFTNLEPPAGGTDSRWAVGGLYDFNQDTIRFTGAVGPVFAYSEALTQQDIEEDYRRGIGWATNNRAYVRVLAEDNFGTLRDLSKVPTSIDYTTGNAVDTIDMLQGVRIDDSVDKRVSTASINVFRDHGKVNLSPLMTESFVNRKTAADTYSSISYPNIEVTSYSGPTESSPTTFLNIGRQVKIQMSRMPYGLEPDEVTSLAPQNATDWVDLFVGRIDSVDFGKDVMSVNCRDQGGILADLFMESDDDEDASRKIPDNSTLQEAIDIVVSNNYSSPWGLSAPSTYEPIASNWALSEGTIERDLVLSAINKLSSQIAWTTRYKWGKFYGSLPSTPGSGTSVTGQEFLLTLSDPERDKVLCDSFISTEDYVDISKLSLDISGVRNKVRISYWDYGFPTILPTGVPTFRTAAVSSPELKAATVTDTDSQTKYGTRFMEIQEDRSSLIDSNVEADRMVNGILSDLAEPLAITSINAKDIIEIELNDMLKVMANNQSFDTDQYYAVSTMQIDFKEGFADVSCGLRGKPSSGSTRHIAMQRTGNSGRQGIISPADGVRPTASAIARSNDIMSVIGKFGGQDNVIANSNFEQLPDGGSIPPIGWAMPNPTTLWPTHVGVRSIADGYIAGQTGSFMIDLKAAHRAIVSDYFPVKKDAPYKVSVWANCSDSAATIDAEVIYYSDKGGSAAVSTSGVLSTAIGSSGTSQVRQRDFYVNIPSAGNVTYARVSIYSASLGSATNMYVDRIAMAPAAPFTRSTKTGNLNLLKPPVELTKYEIDAVVAGTVDVGANLDSANNRIEIPEDGIYEFTGKIHAQLVTTEADPSFATESGNNLPDRGEHGMYSAIAVNGSRVAYGSSGHPVFVLESGSNRYYICVCEVVFQSFLSKGDYVELFYAGRFFHNTAQQSQILTNFSGLTMSKVKGEMK